MAEKARLSHKEAKAPDEFITLTGQAFAWGQKHQQTVIWGAVAAAVLVGGARHRHRVSRRPAS